MAVAMIGPKFYAWDRNGKPLAFGKLYTYQARTNTPKPTYQSEDQVVENTNPVILNGEGYADVYLDGSYKMVLKDDKDNEIWSSDPVTAAQAKEWVNCLPATYNSPTSFRVNGNFTTEYDEGRRVRMESDSSIYSYGTIESSSFAGGMTTVTLLQGSDGVPTNLSGVCASIIGKESAKLGENDKRYQSVFSTVDNMKNGLTNDGGVVSQLDIDDKDLLAKTHGYYGGWAAMVEPVGAAEYTLTTLQRVRDSKSDIAWVPDGYSDHYLFGGTEYVAVLNVKGGILDAKAFGAKGDGTTEDTDALEALFAKVDEYMTMYFPAGAYPIKRMLRTDKSHIHLTGEDKYLARIVPHSTGFESTSGTSLVWLGDGTSTARIRVTKIQISAAGGTLANDTDGLTIHPFFNADIEDCRFQGGNYVTRETGGMRIVDGRHTRVHNNQFHNGFCHGLTIDEHLNGLNITGNAFDETSCGIKSFGNILEMNITGSNEFGSAIRNSFYPAPTDRRVIDLEIGVHGSVGIVGNIMTGGSETEYGIRYGYIDNLRIVGNQIGKNKRFGICGAGTGRNLTIAANNFNGNGSDATDLDPANGLRDPDATPFCSDIYINTAFNYPINILGNTSDLDDRAMAWVEGTSNAISTSGFSCSANNSRFDDIAYVHQTTIKSNDVVQDASFMQKGIAPVEGVITSRTVTRGTPQVSTISVPGVTPGDNVTASVRDFGGLDYNLVLSVEVQGNNQVRWSLVNTSDTPVAITDTTIVISATKA